MALTKASSANFKMALRWAGVHLTSSFRKSWFFLSHCAIHDTCHNTRWYFPGHHQSCLLLLLVNVLQTDFSHNMLGRPQARGKDVSISGPWSQLINWFVRTLIYRKKIVLGSASLSYTRIALAFWNFAYWRQCFFLVQTLLTRVLNKDWIKLLMTRSLWLLRTGHGGHSGLV